MFCLPTGDPFPASAAEAQPSASIGVRRQRAPERGQGHLLSIDDLEGAQETDVDTGLRLSSSDLSVVSAYSAPSRFCSPKEAPRPPERGSSLWSERRGFREGPLPTGGGETAGASWATLPLFKGTSGSSATAVTAPPASDTSSLTESPPELPSNAPQARQTGRDVPTPSVPAGCGDNDTEEFYI